MIDREEIRARVRRDGLEPGRAWATVGLDRVIRDRAALLDELDRVAPAARRPVPSPEPEDARAAALKRLYLAAIGNAGVYSQHGWSEEATADYAALRAASVPAVQVHDERLEALIEDAVVAAFGHGREQGRADGFIVVEPKQRRAIRDAAKADIEAANALRAAVSTLAAASVPAAPSPAMTLLYDLSAARQNVTRPEEAEAILFGFVDRASDIIAGAPASGQEERLAEAERLINEAWDGPAAPSPEAEAAASEARRVAVDVRNGKMYRDRIVTALEWAADAIRAGAAPSGEQEEREADRDLARLITRLIIAKAAPSEEQKPVPADGMESFDAPPSGAASGQTQNGGKNG